MTADAVGAIIALVLTLGAFSGLAWFGVWLAAGDD